MVGEPKTPEWVAADVCRVLGITEHRSVLRNFKRSEKGVHTMHSPQGGHQEVLTVKEPGLYRLIFRSRKPEAERFRQWVTHEVLPTLREYGCYPAPDVTVRETAIVRIDEEALGRAIGAELNNSITPRLDRHEERLDELTHEVRQIAPRKPITPKVQRLHVHVAYRMYHGMCPCCAGERIVDEEGRRISGVIEFDHFYLRTRNGKTDTWPVCRKCNTELRNGDFHREAQTHFDGYQKRRRQFENIIQPPFLPGMRDCTRQ
jgi:prophage antirepressor-like protein